MEGSQKITDEAESGSEQPPIVDLKKPKISGFMGWTRRNREPRNGWVEPKKPRNRPWETEKPTKPENRRQRVLKPENRPGRFGLRFSPKTDPNRVLLTPKFMDNLHFSQTISPTLVESDSEFDKISYISVDEVSVTSVVNDLEYVNCFAFVDKSDCVENMENVNVNVVENLNEYSCKQNVNETVLYTRWKSECDSKWNKNEKEVKMENVEKIRIENITYKTLKKENKLKGELINSSDSISSSDLSDFLIQVIPQK